MKANFICQRATWQCPRWSKTYNGQPICIMPCYITYYRYITSVISVMSRVLHMCTYYLSSCG